MSAACRTATDAPVSGFLHALIYGASLCGSSHPIFSFSSAPLSGGVNSPSANVGGSGAGIAVDHSDSDGNYILLGAGLSCPSSPGSVVGASKCDGSGFSPSGEDRIDASWKNLTLWYLAQMVAVPVPARNYLATLVAMVMITLATTVKTSAIRSQKAGVPLAFPWRLRSQL